MKTNAASDVQPPKPSARRLDVDERRITMLLEATKGTRLEVPVVVAALTGVRRGELLALRRQDVDFDRKRLVVSESLEETQKFGLRFKAPKSGKVRVFASRMPCSMCSAPTKHSRMSNAFDWARPTQIEASYSAMKTDPSGRPIR